MQPAPGYELRPAPAVATPAERQWSHWSARGIASGFVLVVLSGIAASTGLAHTPDTSSSAPEAARTGGSTACTPVDRGQVERAVELANEGRTDEAWELIEPWLDAAPNDPIVAFDAGYIRKTQRRWLEAIGHFERTLQLTAHNPEFHADLRRGAFRLRILAIAHLGLPHLALDQAASQPGALLEADWQYLWGDRAAKEITWGLLPPASAAQRFDGTDRALERLDERSAQLPETGRWPRRRWLQDHLVALRDRQRMVDAIAVYEQLLDELEPGEELPPWVLVAAADAYLYEEHPRTAEALYRRALEQQTDPARDAAPVDQHLAHFYALLESERLRDALDAIDALDARVPAWLAPRNRGDDWRVDDWRVNWGALQVDTTAALARGFVDLPARAEARLQPLVEAAPANHDLRRALGSILYWRGWSRCALQEIEITLAHEPESVASRLGRASVLFDLGHMELAGAEIEALRANFPEHLYAQRLGHLWDVHHLWEVVITGEQGDSDGDTFGSRDTQLEAWVYAPPWRHRLRPYLHAYHAEASFPEGIGRFERLGLGVEYRGAVTAREWVYDLRVEVHTNDAGDLFATSDASALFTGGRRVGFSAAAGLQPNDHWSGRLELERHSTSMPLRGWRLGIDADRLSASGTYRFSELARLDLGLSVSEYSDGNRRRSANLSAERRLFSDPRWHVTLLPAIYVSDNSRRGAPYYNPRQDASHSLGLMTEYLGWRRYEDSLWQRLVITAGRYQQDAFDERFEGRTRFDGRNTFSVRYEHDWRLGPELSLRYGIGWASRVFDGEREERVWFYFSTDWRPGKTQSRGGAS